MSVKGTTPVVRRFAGGGFGTNGYVVSCPDTQEALLVDPGAAVGEMLAEVQRAGLKVVAIALTHAHIDHVEGVGRAKEETGAPIHLHRDAEPFYRQAPVQAQMFGMQIAPLPPIDEYLREGQVLRFGRCELTVVDTPGHAPGHTTFIGEGFALVGDCIFAGSIGRTDLPGGDLRVLMSSIRKKILTLPDDTMLYSGHGDETTVGHERVSNPFLVPNFGGSSFA